MQVMLDYTLHQLEVGLMAENIQTEPWMLYFFGGLMQVTSILGFLMNVIVLHSYCSKKMSSFEVMCVSKTLSNNCIIVCYIVYNAPITIFSRNLFTGPTFLNILVNQSVTYGIYIIGPLTQFLISINRVLVMFFVKKSISENHQKLTYFILSLFWFSSVPILAYGTTNDCSVIYVPAMLNWYSGGCDDEFGNGIAGFVIILAVLSNICNFLVVIKLVTSMKSGVTDSISSKKRRQKSQKLFIQNCIQDWIFAIDSINSTFIHRLVDSVLFRFFFDVYSNLMTPVLDGCVMLFFNSEGRQRSADRRISQKKSTAIMISNHTNTTAIHRSSLNLH